jgi:hypothetical protein
VIAFNLLSGLRGRKGPIIPNLFFMRAAVSLEGSGIPGGPPEGLTYEMYGPPSDCKGKARAVRQVCANVFGLCVESRPSWP